MQFQIFSSLAGCKTVGASKLVLNSIAIAGVSIQFLLIWKMAKTMSAGKMENISWFKQISAVDLVVSLNGLNAGKILATAATVEIL